MLKKHKFFNIRFQNYRSSDAANYRGVAGCVPAEGVAEDTAAKRGGWSEGKAFPLVKFEG